MSFGFEGFRALGLWSAAFWRVLVEAVRTKLQSQMHRRRSSGSGPFSDGLVTG